jgi:hypothetical protein
MKNLDPSALYYVVDANLLYRTTLFCMTPFLVVINESSVSSVALNLPGRLDKFWDRPSSLHPVEVNNVVTVDEEPSSEEEEINIDDVDAANEEENNLIDEILRHAKITRHAAGVRVSNQRGGIARLGRTDREVATKVAADYMSEWRIFILCKTEDEVAEEDLLLNEEFEEAAVRMEEREAAAAAGSVASNWLDEDDSSDDLSSPEVGVTQDELPVRHQLSLQRYGFYIGSPTGSESSMRSGYVDFTAQSARSISSIDSPNGSESSMSMDFV